MVTSKVSTALFRVHLVIGRQVDASDKFTIVFCWGSMVTAALNDEDPGKPEVGYSSGKVLVARGSLALPDHVASRMNAAFGDTQPKVEVRFKDLSVSADIIVKDVTESMAELPTLPNELMKSFRKLRAKKHLIK